MKERKKPIHLLTPDDLDALAASCSRTAPSGIRDAALIMILYGSGLRVSEALALLPTDVDLDARQVYVRRGKGEFERRVGLLPAAVPWIQQWVGKRGELRVARTRPLFCAIAKGKTGKPVSRQAVDAMLKRRGRNAGLEVERIHAHALRHSLAVRMHAKLPAAAVQAQLGHASLATTSRYLAHLSAQDLAEGMAGI